MSPIRVENPAIVKKGQEPQFHNQIINHYSFFFLVPVARLYVLEILGGLGRGVVVTHTAQIVMCSV